jgi:hypothetical protein
MAILAVFMVSAIAQPVLLFHGRDNAGGLVVLRLMHSQCSNESVLAHLRRYANRDDFVQFKDARLTWGGRDWASCWIERDGMIYSMDEEGAPLTPVHKSGFLDRSI